MIGGPWTADQKAAYRATFSIGRIGDEVWVLVALAWFIICDVTFAYAGPGGSTFFVVVLGGFAVLYVLTWRLLVPWLARTMPEELRASLPAGRFEGASSPTAPRTYRELFRRWLTKDNK
jgi:hypothetical protein